MKKLDKNGTELNVNDEVMFMDRKFTIHEFKLRSYGYVVYEGDYAHPITDLVKVEEDPKVLDNKLPVSHFYKQK